MQEGPGYLFVKQERSNGRNCLLNFCLGAAGATEKVIRRVSLTYWYKSIHTFALLSFSISLAPAHFKSYGACAFLNASLGIVFCGVRRRARNAKKLQWKRKCTSRSLAPSYSNTRVSEQRKEAGVPFAPGILGIMISSCRRVRRKGYCSYLNTQWNYTRRGAPPRGWLLSHSERAGASARISLAEITR